MGRQHFFWLGVFVALIVGLPAALLYTNSLPGYAILAASLAIGFIFGLVLVLVVVIFFKDQILERLTGSTRDRIETITDEGIEVISSLQRGDLEQARVAGGKLANPIVEWFLWTQFYRWVIGSAIALLVVAGTFAGTILLAEQNNKFDVQNELASLTLTDTLKSVLTNRDRKIDWKPFTNSEGVYEFTAGRCILSYKPEDLRSAGAARTLNAVATAGQIAHAIYLVEKPNIHSDAVQALKNLLEDDDRGVALSALMVLERTGYIHSDGVFDIDRVLLGRSVSLISPVQLNVSNSLLQGLRCPNCKPGNIESSILDEFDFGIYNGTNNLVVTDQPSDIQFMRNSVVFSFEKFGESQLDDSEFTNLNELIEIKFNAPDLEKNQTNVRMSLSRMEVDGLAEDFACVASDRSDGFCDENDFFECEEL